jgi:hypothetical protein
MVSFINLMLMLRLLEVLQEEAAQHDMCMVQRREVIGARTEL